MLTQYYWFRTSCHDVLEILERKAKRAPWIIKLIRIVPMGGIRIDATENTHEKIKSFLSEIYSKEFQISDSNEN